MDLDGLGVSKLSCILLDESRPEEERVQAGLAYLDFVERQISVGSDSPIDLCTQLEKTGILECIMDGKIELIERLVGPRTRIENDRFVDVPMPVREEAGFAQMRYYLDADNEENDYLGIAQILLISADKGVPENVREASGLIALELAFEKRFNLLISAVAFGSGEDEIHLLDQWDVPFDSVGFPDVVVEEALEMVQRLGSARRDEIKQTADSGDRRELLKKYYDILKKNRPASEKGGQNSAPTDKRVVSER